MAAKTIELNGKRYDAVTGKLLGNASARPASIEDHTRPAPAFDIIAPTNSVRRSAIESPKTPPGQPKTPNVHRSVPHHVIAHPVQHAKTLMRKAVQRPSTSFKRHTKVVSNTAALVKNPEITIAPKFAVTTIDVRKQRHAQRVRPSTLIRHFNTQTPVPGVPATSPITVARRPKLTTASPMRPAGTRTMAAAVAAAPVKPRQSSTDIFERALEQATSHKQPPHPVQRTIRKSHRLRNTLGIATVSFIVLVIAGVFVYQNNAVIRLSLASSKAGIHATLPAWHPGGFDIASLAAAPGSVTVRFNSSQASRGFSITQTASNWDSGALLSEYVLPNANAAYQTIQSAGNTIYTFGNNNATWVTNGIWYRLTTNGALSTSQIVRLATSM